jgi:type VI secretion system protein ImpC
MSKQADQKKEVVVKEQEAEASTLSQMMKDWKLVRSSDKGQEEMAKGMLESFIQRALSGQLKMTKNVEASILSDIAAIDKLISDQLNEIMHAEEFQKLEGSWRGLHYLVMNSETSTMLKIRVLNTNKKDLLKDLERAVEFDQSGLFKQVYEEEFGTFGGSPYGALVGDYEFTNHPQDITLLEKLSNVAASAHAPFISAASPQLFGMDEFSELANVRDLEKIFDRVEYAKWRSFRDSEDSRYVGLTLPRTLMRLPYGRETIPTETFQFEEKVDGKDHSKYLWGNAAYAYASRLTEAFAMHSWTVAIRGVEGGGLVQGLPVHTFKTDEGDVALKCPTEVAITDRRENEYSKLGFLPLVHCKNTDYAAFFGGQSCNKAKKYDSDAANASARLSTLLPNMFAISRFAHYIKCMMRDKVGSFMSRADCEAFLNKWILNYVSPDDMAPAEIKAKHPLRDAEIKVYDVPGKPGVYRAVAHLRPHFQLEEINVSLRLVAELKKGKK